MALFFPKAAGLLAASLLLGGFATQAQPSVQQWDKRFGSTSYEFLSALQPTSDGGFLLGGSSYAGSGGDKTQPSQGNYDYWIVKADATGTKQWDKSFGGPDADELSVVQQTSDGGYLIGGNSMSGIGGDKSQASRGDYDFWLLKLDAAGTKQWDKSFGTSDRDFGWTIQQTSDGGCIVGFTTAGGVEGDKTQPSRGGTDFWLVKLDAQGNKQWDRAFGGSGLESLGTLITTTDGGYLLGGSSGSGIGGDKTQASQGIVDMWVVKVDAQGNKQWDRTFGGLLQESVSQLRQTQDGGYILGGYSYSGVGGDKTESNRGDADFWIVKISSNGTKEWDKTLGGTERELCRTIVQTADGGYLAGGESDSGVSGEKTQASLGSTDFWIVKLNAQGAKLWDQTLGGTGADNLVRMQLTTDGGCLLGGHSDSPVGGAKSQPSQGMLDYWVIKLTGITTAAVPAATRQRMHVYPNPARDYITLRLPAGVARPTQLELLDATGRVVWQQLLALQAESTLKLGRQHAGLYLLRLQDAAGTVTTQRLVVE